MKQKPLLETDKTDQALKESKNQDDMDKFIANGMNIIHSKKASDRYIPAIINAEEPVEPIAEFLLHTVSRLENGAKAHGVKLEPAEVAQAGNILMGQIIEVAETAGLEKLTDEEKYMAFSLAVGKYIDDALKTGKMTPEQLQQLSMEVQDTDEGRAIVEETKNAANQMNQPNAV